MTHIGHEFNDAVINIGTATIDDPVKKAKPGGSNPMMVRLNLD